jgi:hypothetical protein
MSPRIASEKRPPRILFLVSLLAQEGTVVSVDGSFVSCHFTPTAGDDEDHRGKLSDRFNSRNQYDSCDPMFE